MAWTGTLEERRAKRNAWLEKEAKRQRDRDAAWRYYWRHREWYLATKREYRKRNIEKEAARVKAWKENNPEKVRAYLEATREKRREYHKQYWRRKKAARDKLLASYAGCPESFEYRGNPITYSSP